MTYLKGFSLLEVLISLMLVTTFSLVLLEHQGQASQLLMQLELHTKSSQFLEQIDESLFVGSAQIPALPFPTLFMSHSFFKRYGTVGSRFRYVESVR